MPSKAQPQAWIKDSKQELEIHRRSGARRDPETGSTLELRNGFYVLHLRGAPYQRGLAQGKLLKKEILDSRISQYYGNLLLDIYRSSDFIGKIPPFLRQTLGELLEWWFYAPLERIGLPETREEIYGVADAAGLNRRDAIRALLAPDLLEHLAAGFLKGGKEALGSYYLGGCSGAYARNTALKNRDGALFARNMDFPGYLVWKYPTVAITHPEESVEVLVKAPGGDFRSKRKQKQPYLYISAAGFPGFGLTGMNASGIAMGTFVCFSKNFSRKHLPTLDFNHYLLTRAQSLEGIIHLVESKKLRSASPHVVVFADARQAISIEVDAARSIVRPMPKGYDIHVQTNHFLNPLLKKKEFEFPLERENTIGRFRLLKDALQENYGRIDVPRMIDIISCNLDLASRTTRLLGDFPGQNITLTSAVFEPHSGNFWVASGKPPAVCYNRYRGFNLFRELKNQGGRARLPAYHRSNLPVFRDTTFSPVTDKAKESIACLMRSQERLKKGEVEEAIQSLERAWHLYPDPGYQYLRGILYLIQGQAGRALEIIRRVQEQYVFPAVKQDALSLWEGRCLDILGKRKEAKACYGRLLRTGSPVRHLRKALKHSRRRSFTADQLPRTIDYTLLGPLQFL